jgi:hypothetical protein
MTALLEQRSQAGGRFRLGARAVRLGRRGGSVTSPAKARAARKNAKKRRPRKGKWPLIRGRQDWATPPVLFAALDREFHFTVDVAASAVKAKCARYFTEQHPPGDTPHVQPIRDVHVPD